MQLFTEQVRQIGLCQPLPFRDFTEADRLRIVCFQIMQNAVHPLGVARLRHVFRIAQHAVRRIAEQDGENLVDLRHACKRCFRCIAQIGAKRQQHCAAKRRQPLRQQASGQSPAAEADTADLRIKPGAEAVGDLQRQKPCRHAGCAEFMAAARIKQQYLARPCFNALPVSADAAAAAQYHAQFQFLMQVHGAIYHVNNKHGTVCQFGMRDQFIFIVGFHFFLEKASLSGCRRIFIGDKPAPFLHNNSKQRKKQEPLGSENREDV